MPNDDNENQKKRKFPWKTAYSLMSAAAVEERIGISMMQLSQQVIAPSTMLAKAGYNLLGSNVMKKETKDRVYENIKQFLDIGVSPLDATNFNEENVKDLVLFILAPILQDFRRRTGRSFVKLFREKQLLSTDTETGGFEEFVVVDAISLRHKKYIFLVEAKRVSLAAGMGQCMLAMKDMGGRNNGGVVYGFVTTGDSWRMLSYDGALFQVTDKLHVVFDTMGNDKDKWMNQYSLLVDCVYAVLDNGGNREGGDVVLQ